MDRRRKRVTYRPSKVSSVMGGIMGGIFVLIGIFVAIPAFGPFGVLWTLAAAGIGGYHLYAAFGKDYAGPEIHIEEGPDTPSLQRRMEELQGLYDRRLITQEEYEKKREEILRDL